ncbi:MAG: hypothetical protein OXE93_08515 [bacterium]|nr:hypothetical protein [bacterium]MCY4164233.1 hypothetical protein [bacterium]MCY4257171.1 hypothetical protein [bacterium]
MGRGSESFQKRQREKNKRERAAAKQARRHGKLDDPLGLEEASVESERSDAELYEDFRLLNEKYQAGGIDDETFERGREEIFEKLGLEVHS